MDWEDNEQTQSELDESFESAPQHVDTEGSEEESTEKGDILELYKLQHTVEEVEERLALCISEYHEEENVGQEDQGEYQE